MSLDFQQQDHQLELFMVSIFARQAMLRVGRTSVNVECPCCADRFEFRLHGKGDDIRGACTSPGCDLELVL